MTMATMQEIVLLFDRARLSIHIIIFKQSGRSRRSSHPISSSARSRFLRQRTVRRVRNRSEGGDTHEGDTGENLTIIAASVFEAKRVDLIE